VKCFALFVVSKKILLLKKNENFALCLY